MKTIPLSQGKVAIVDDEDYERVSRLKWSLHTAKNKKRLYASSGYAPERGKYVQVLLHRFILNAPDGVQVDHIDLDGLNCQKINLRFCSNAQNGRNHGLNKNNQSGYKGVYWDSTRSLWHAQITVNYRVKFLGRFGTAVEAALAYDSAALKYHGAFARLNFPDELK